MLRRDQDFVYCEIPVAGHGWPGDARDEMWRYFDVRRLAVAPGRRAKGRFAITQEPLSSFAAKPTKEETRYFGHPGKPPAARDLKTLLADLDAGGGLAIRAVEGLLQLKGKAAASAVAKRLSRKRSQGTRKGAAEVLGAMGEAASAKPLHKVLADDDLVVVGAAARALGGIPSEATPKAWTRCVADLGARFTKRKSGGQWAYPDYERFLSTVGDLVRGTERRKAADGVPALRAVAETFVFPTPRVRTSRRGGQDAERPRRRLARAVVEALAAIGTKDCAPLLKQFAEKPGLGVADEASNALADLKRP
jgi:HEAT repeat protein